eukprot:SAG22_NODE_10253_length_545_cov_0.811659_1_plen_48_part_01
MDGSAMSRRTAASTIYCTAGAGAGAAKWSAASARAALRGPKKRAAAVS